MDIFTIKTKMVTFGQTQKKHIVEYLVQHIFGTVNGPTQKYCGTELNSM